nr:EOG090X09NR [Eulimnadia texana]
MDRKSAIQQKVHKKIVHVGKGANVTFSAGTKVLFHFTTQVLRSFEDETADGPVIDDSRKFGKPMELVLGKQFKLEVWESAIQTMALNEVAEFRIHKSLCLPYPIVAKTLRESYWGKKTDHVHTHHCCGGLAMQKLGYEDLDELLKEPKDLLFTFELLKVDYPEDYRKEIWQMDETEKINAVPKLREEGNRHYAANQIPEAAKAYSQALGILEQLQLKEKPGDDEWLTLNKMKIPLLLNYSQCQLLQENYYDAIEQCTKVLEQDPDNVKALYRRGMAHIKVWNPDQAQKDLTRAAELDPALKRKVHEELTQLEELKKSKDKSDQKWLKNVFGASGKTNS